MNANELAKRFDDAASRVSERLRGPMEALPDHVKASVQEIRLRREAPLVLRAPKGDFFFTRSGAVTTVYRDSILCVNADDIDQTFAALCEYSIHSFQNEIREGFITIRGGHRAGVCGTAVYGERGISGLRDVSSINLRIARQHYGAADRLVWDLCAADLPGFLLAGPPGCGKTTLLRDLARQLSAGATGRYYRVAVVDERGEIAGIYRGVPQNNLGPCCDCLDGYRKADGILHALRCLSPDVIVCDEIGAPEEIDAVKMGVHAGVRMVASVHAGGISELKERPQVKALIQTGAFSHIALMRGRGTPGVVEQVLKAGDIVENHRAHFNRGDRMRMGIHALGGVCGACPPA